MSKPRLVLIVSLAAAGVASSASADVPPLGARSVCVLSDALAPSATVRPTATNESRPVGSSSPFTSSVLGDLTRDYLAGSGPASPAANAANSQQADVRELPPLPGSAALFISAVLSMGGWHLVRSARHLHWGALPDWYHTGGPLQIGHAVPLDLDFHAVPPCWFESADQGGGGDRALLYRVPRGDGPRCYAQGLFLTIAAPRGPPALAR